MNIADNSVRRASLETVGETLLGDKKMYAGSVQNLKDSDIFRKKSLAHFSPAWVALRPNEILERHYHPVTSYLFTLDQIHLNIVGEKDQLISKFSLVKIPAGVDHEFTSLKNSEFNGLAFNFDSAVLFSRDVSRTEVGISPYRMKEGVSFHKLTERLQIQNQDCDFKLELSLRNVEEKAKFSFMAEDFSWLAILDEGLYIEENQKLLKYDFVSLNEVSCCIFNQGDELKRILQFRFVK